MQPHRECEIYILEVWPRKVEFSWPGGNQNSPTDQLKATQSMPGGPESQLAGIFLTSQKALTSLHCHGVHTYHKDTP